MWDWGGIEYRHRHTECNVSRVAKHVSMSDGLSYAPRPEGTRPCSNPRGTGTKLYGRLVTLAEVLAVCLRASGVCPLLYTYESNTANGNTSRNRLLDQPEATVGDSPAKPKKLDHEAIDMPAEEKQHQPPSSTSSSAKNDSQSSACLSPGSRGSSNSTPKAPVSAKQQSNNQRTNPGPPPTPKQPIPTTPKRQNSFHPPTPTVTLSQSPESHRLPSFGSQTGSSTPLSASILSQSDVRTPKVIIPSPKSAFVPASANSKGTPILSMKPLSLDDSTPRTAQASPFDEFSIHDPFPSSLTAVARPPTPTKPTSSCFAPIVPH